MIDIDFAVVYEVYHTIACNVSFRSSNFMGYVSGPIVTLIS